MKGFVNHFDVAFRQFQFDEVSIHQFEIQGTVKLKLNAERQLLCFCVINPNYFLRFIFK